MIHADSAARVQKETCVLGTREMAALVAVHDFRHGRAERIAAGFQHKADVQRVVEHP